MRDETKHANGTRVWRQKQKERGLCPYCTEPVDPGYSKCARHRITAAAACKRYREKEKARDQEAVEVLEKTIKKTKALAAPQPDHTKIHAWLEKRERK